MSKSSKPLPPPARAKPSSSSGRNSPTCSGENSVGIQPSAISAASVVFFGPDRGDVDRDPLLHRRDRQLQRLARPVRQRQLERLAVELDALARQRHPHDRDVLARALQLAARSAGRASPRRPAARWSRSRAASARPRAGRSSPRSSPSSRRERPGIWKIAEPSLIARSWPARARRGSSRRRSRRPPRSRPSRSRAAPPPARARAARCGGQPEAPVADVQAELHCKRPPSRCRAPAPTALRVRQARATLSPRCETRHRLPARRAPARRCSTGIRDQPDRRRRLHRRPRRHLPDARRAPPRRPHDASRLRPRVGRVRAHRSDRAAPRERELRMLEDLLDRVAREPSASDLAQAIAEYQRRARRRSPDIRRAAAQRAAPIRSTSRSRCSGENGLVRKRSAPASLGAALGRRRRSRR